MGTQTTLIVDDQISTLKTIISTLEDANRPFVVSDSSQQAWEILQADPTVSLVLLRGFGKQIQGTELCRNIRTLRSREEVSVIMIFDEAELTHGAAALIAGATDLLVAPFEPRELRMRANIVPADQVRRIDKAHTLAEAGDTTAEEPEYIVPTYDAAAHRFTFGRYENRVARWENDPDTKRVPLDRIIECPDCEAVPTFRPGCGSCGSAWVDHESLIHHYACAHVGPESEFRSSANDGLSCPKCRTNDLVVGADFDQVEGCMKCNDCGSVFNQPEMICHCLACQRRFPASEGKIHDIYGYQVGAAPNSARIAAPNFQTMESRSSSTAQRSQ